MNEQEQAFITALKEAEELGSLLAVRKSTASREQALAFTNLQQARLWAERDVAIKESRNEAQEVEG